MHEAEERYPWHYLEENDPNTIDFIDWEAWTPPNLTLALFRRTAQSCCVSDWNNLEKGYITWIQADKAKRQTDKYARDAVQKDFYKVIDLSLDDGLGSGHVQGYGPVEKYVESGEEIPCTATTKAGKAYANGNYNNSTKRLKYLGYPSSAAGDWR
ncbi:hypothetical protein IFR05_000610 [Cadophora sp. M221]|nr:hypothetical protein IFR05_000610 [Cadophora sp. M221]